MRIHGLELLQNYPITDIFRYDTFTHLVIRLWTAMRGKASRACEKMPPPLPLFVRFAAKSAACSLSAHGTVALCGYRRAEFDKKQGQSAKLAPFTLWFTL